MVEVDFARREIRCKIAYLGPAGAGKRTNLRALLDRVSAFDIRWESSEEGGDRSVRLEFCPREYQQLVALRTRFEVAAPTGLIQRDETVANVLSGVDGLVFVADSRLHCIEANRGALAQLQEGLRRVGSGLDALPWVFQWNKRELPDALIRSEMDRLFGRPGAPRISASARRGEGVVEAFSLVARAILARFARRHCDCAWRIDELWARGRRIRTLPLSQGG